jgi:hypothetical protein
VREHLAADVRLIAGAGQFNTQDTFPALRELIVKTFSAL